MFTDTKVRLIFSKNKLIKLNLSFWGYFLTISAKTNTLMEQFQLKEAIKRVM